MDPSNYKIHKKSPIHYGPKKVPLRQPQVVSKKPATTLNPPKPSTQAVKQPVARPEAIISKLPTTKSQSSAPKKTPKDPKFIDPQKPNTSKSSSLGFEFAEPPKRPQKSKAKKAYRAFLFTLLTIVILGLVVGGYLYYKKVYIVNKSKPSNSTELNNSNNSNPINSSKVNDDPILNADFIVYGLKVGSLFATNRTDYQQDANVPTIKVIARSTYPNDKREITINQQKVESNFAENPNGLKKMADSIGVNMPLTTDKGTSYIITGNATGIISIGATLISVRSSASLAIVEWQQIFNDLEPVQT